jgi:hypothetical protein
MPGHSFEVVAVHGNTGLIDVMWDGDKTHVMTCRLPLDGQGNVADGEEFIEGIITQCYQYIQRLDKLSLLGKDELEKHLNRRYDVTNALVMWNVLRGENTPTQKGKSAITQNDIGSFDLKSEVK